MSISNASLQGSGICGEAEAEKAYEPQVVDSSKETVSSKSNSADKYELTETTTANTRPAYVQPRQNPSTEQTKWRKPPPLTKKTSVTDTFWERINQFLPMQWQWMCQGRPHAQKQKINTEQNRLCSSPCFVFFYFVCTHVWLLWFGGLLFILVCFCCSLEREKHGAKWGELWRYGGRERLWSIYSVYSF